MSTLTLKFNAPPFSVNKSHYRNGNRTKECRAWGDLILEQLAPFEDEIEDFRLSFDKLNQSLNTELIFLYPSAILLTKKGYVSRRSSDLSNIEKMLVDLIFDPKFYERGFNNLNLDDTLVTSQLSKKRISPTDSYQIIVKITISPLSELSLY
jgi:hypothetical protein